MLQVTPALKGSFATFAVRVWVPPPSRNAPVELMVTLISGVDTGLVLPPPPQPAKVRRINAVTPANTHLERAPLCMNHLLCRFESGNSIVPEEGCKTKNSVCCQKGGNVSRNRAEIAALAGNGCCRAPARGQSAREKHPRQTSASEATAETPGRYETVWPIGLWFPCALRR